MDAPSGALRLPTALLEAWRYITVPGLAQALSQRSAGIVPAQTLAAQDPPRYIAKVDATENNELSERHGIKGFPTLVFYA